MSMTLPIFIPFVLFSHALNKVWRRHRLRNTVSTPTSSTSCARKRDAHIHQAYIERTGPDQAQPSPVTTSPSGPAQVAQFVERLRPSDQPIGRVDQLVAVALLRHR